MAKNNKKQVKPAQVSVQESSAQTQVNNNQATLDAMMSTTLGKTSMDRNHQVDLLKLAHERFFVDQDAVAHTGFSQETIDKFNHINALGIATVYANEINSGNSDFAIVLRKAALPELKEAFAEIGVSLDDTKLLTATPTSDGGETVSVPADAVEVSEKTKESLSKDAEVLNKTAGKTYDPTKIESEEELKTALSSFLALNNDSKLMDSISKCIAFYSAWAQVKANRKIDSAEAALKNAKDKNAKANAEKNLASAKAELEAVKSEPKSDIFRKIVGITGRTGTLVYGLGSHLFNVTAASGSPVSAFCELYAHSTDKKTGKCKYSEEEIADVIKCIVSIAADEVQSKGLALIEAENKLPEKDRVKEHIETGEKNVKYAGRVLACISCAPSDFVSNLSENFKSGNNFAKKTVLAIKRAFYHDVAPEMMAKVKIDSMLANCTQYAGVISNLFRNPSDPIAGVAKSNIIDLEFKTDEEIKAEDAAAAEAAKKAAEEKAKEDAKKAAKGKAKSKVEKK